MKIVDKLLHLILGVIVLIVALILLCAANPGVRETAAAIAQRIGPIYVPPVEEEELAADTGVISPVSGSMAVITQ